MAIDRKSIQVFLWKALSISMKTCYNTAKKYPKTSFVSTFFFLLYVFLPLVFIFLICSLLVSGLAFIVYRLFFSADPKKFENVKGYKKTDEKPPIVKDDDMGKNVSVSSYSQTTRRRNSNEKERENYAQSSIEDKNVVRPAGSNDDLFDKTAVVEENLKEIREVNVDSANEKGKPSSSKASQIVASPPFTSGCVEESTHFFASRTETEGESSDDSEEDAREDRNMAVEWSVDDQMNLSCVGNSEIERNIRLENLIERRKARKLLSIKVRNTLMNPATNDSRDIPAILVARKNPFLSKNFDNSPIPGSAPSVISPMQNHFGSQDRTFHEFSFNHGLPEEFETSRTGNQSDKKVVDKLTNTKYTQENEEDGSEVEKKQIVHEKINDGSRSSSSSEENIPLSRPTKAELSRYYSCLDPKDVDADSDDNDQEHEVQYNTDSLLYEKTAGNSFFGEKRGCHAPSNSLASDLQVEVSEVGSPQSTSSNEKSYIFDDYINKEITSGGEDTGAVSSHLSGVDINESNSTEVNEVSEKDITDSGFSRINHNLDPNTSNLQPEKVVREEEISSYSQPSNLHESIQGQTIDFKPEHFVPDAPSMNDSEHSTKQVVAHTSTSQNLEEASPQEVNVVDESVKHNNDENESLKSSQVIEPEAMAEFPVPDAETNSKSLEDTDGTLHKHSDLNSSKASDQNNNSSVPIYGDDDPKSIQDANENVRKIVGDDNAVETSKAAEEIKNIDSDSKIKELQEAEPNKVTNQHHAADSNDNSETIKVVESEVGTSTPNEAVVAP